MSVKLYVQIQNIFSSFKVVACLVVIAGGIYELCKGKWLENIFDGFLYIQLCCFRKRSEFK